MPDDAALPPAIWAHLGYAGKQRFDPESLLVTRDDLLSFAVKQDKVADELKQPVVGKQADKQPVLIGNGLLVTPERVEMALHVRHPVRHQRSAGIGSQSAVLHLGKIGFAVFLLFPLAPEFGLGLGGSITPIGRADGE